MSKNAHKSIGWTIVLILFGVIALFTGAKSLLVLIPAAMVIWSGARPTIGNGRN
jgi:hypothetical protein